MDRVPLERVRDNRFQMRMEYGDLADLADSIAGMKAARPETSGLIQVPVARIVLDGEVLDPADYGSVTMCLADELEAVVELAVGHRRFRAFGSLAAVGDMDYETLPVEIQVLDDEAMADLAWSENAQRQDLTPIEEAMAIQRAMEEFGYALGDVAKRWGMSKSAVSNKLRLLQLPEKVQGLVQGGELSERHARELLPLVQVARSPKAAESLAKKAARNGWSAEGLNQNVGIEMGRRTRTINSDLMGWEDWGAGDYAIPLPDGCVAICKDCEHQVRGKCPKPDLYEGKTQRWQMRLLRLAAEKAGIAAADDRGNRPLGAPALKRARERQCEHLRVGFTWYSSNGVLVDEGLPGVYYICDKGRNCDCVKAQEEAEVEADPKQAAYREWEERQEARAVEIMDQTRAEMVGRFRTVLKRTVHETDLALFVALIKRQDDKSRVKYEMESVAEGLADITCGTRWLGKVTRIGRAMQQRARIYGLARLATPMAEVEAEFKVVQDAIEQKELGGWSVGRWVIRQSLDRAREILEALPGHEELREELTRLEAESQRIWKMDE